MDLVHVLSRGVDKREIFLDDQDRFRFIHDLFEFNDIERASNTFYRFYKFNDIASRKIVERRRPRKLLVNLHAFCLMPNHYHLLLSARVEKGIPQFMKKLNMGYAKYFNQKYEREGTLFSRRYKSICIKNQAHFIHIPYYIHLNPLDLVTPEWRNRELKNYQKAISFLNSYRWSSHLDYMGKRNFPSVTQREFLLEFFGGPGEYTQGIKKWLKDIDLSTYNQLFFE